MRLIERKDSEDTAREFIHCIADAMVEKCAIVIAGSYFMSILSDGSQGRKTNDEKELILVRIERNGIPVHFVVSLLEVATFGGANANSIKAAIDSVSTYGNEGDENSGRIPLIDYNTKIFSATDDGASVNFGVYSGVIK